MDMSKIILPSIIQGGMGIAVSDWKLASAVAKHGQIGVISGTGLNSVLIRRLALGDPDMIVRQALSHFPEPTLIQNILNEYFIPGGKAPHEPFKRTPHYNLKGPLSLWQLTVVANFVEVWLAKQGHSGLIGINLLEKIQLPTLPSLYGALLAGVDLVIMGAGIPREIPKALDLLSLHQTATLKIDVDNSDPENLEFDPKAVFPNLVQSTLKRPLFFPIISSSALALNLKRKATGPIQGFIVEGPKAGGHNAPPRGKYPFNEIGEPIYGPRDLVLPEDMKELELPFYYAGSVATPEQLTELINLGAQGIQVGTLFAFAQESGIEQSIKHQALYDLVHKSPPDSYGWIYTDALSSPTGFPFKALKRPDSLSEKQNYLKRTRICDLGYLRHLHKSVDGKILYRCPAEPVEDFQKKEGTLEQTEGKKCLCNALMADVGLGQNQKWGSEGYLLTAGDDFNQIQRILKNGQYSYYAKDVIDYLLGARS